MLLVQLALPNNFLAAVIVFAFYSVFGGIFSVLLEIRALLCSFHVLRHFDMASFHARINATNFFDFCSQWQMNFSQRWFGCVAAVGRYRVLRMLLCPWCEIPSLTFTEKIDWISKSNIETEFTLQNLHDQIHISRNEMCLSNTNFHACGNIFSVCSDNTKNSRCMLSRPVHLTKFVALDFVFFDSFFSLPKHLQPRTCTRKNITIKIKIVIKSSAHNSAQPKIAQ